MKTKKIYIKDWINLKPYDNHSVTDNYYLKISNEIKEIIYLEYNDYLPFYLDEDKINTLSCFISSYFEDIISETNIFISFTNKHQELYNKKLPFYNTSDYYEKEINTQDIQFLIWYYIDTIQDEKFISPNKEVFLDIAHDIMIILEEEYEYAPENKLLKKYYTVAKNETDFYKVREVIDNILFRSYFFYTDTYNTLYDRESTIIEEHKNNNHLISYLKNNRDELLLSSHTKLLSLSGKEWLAEIVGKKHPLYKDILNISPKINGHFLYKGQDKDNVFIEHIASSKKFKLTKKSFDNANSLKENETILFIGIVKWKTEWWFSGIYFTQDFNADLILDEKNSIESRASVNFLDHDSENIDETLQLQYKAFLNFNNQKQLAFLPVSEINNFTKKYIEFFNKSLNLTEKQIKKAIDDTKKDGFFGGHDSTDIIDFDESFETGLVFFNPKSGVEIAFEVNSAFPLKYNNFYNENNTREHVLRLFMTDMLSTELSLFCVNNFKEKLPFFKTSEGEFFLNDLDFILRYFKGKLYYSKPQITFTGKK